MPLQVTDIDVLRDYLDGVVGRADHHAQDVNEIALAIAGAIIWRKDDNPLEVMTREGEMKNIIWVRIANQRYALAYNHDSREIELREKSSRGRVVGHFSNATPVSDIRRIFGSL